MSNLYYRGDSIFLYVQFKDEAGKSIKVDNPMVRILHEKNGEIVDDLEWFDLVQLSENEYFANYTLEHNADYSTYEVIYTAEYGDKVARVIDEFHVIPRSDSYDDVIKLYGYINHQRLSNPLSNSTVTISFSDDSEIVSRTFTKEDGYWESYLYPGEYKFKFSKFGFITQEIVAQIGLEQNEIQFNNIALEAENATNNGNGVHLVTDKFIAREGTPLNGLNIKVFNVFDPTVLIAEDNTDDDGEYKVFLDPGTYLMKISGLSLGENFDQVFRVKVEESGKSVFENLTSNVAVPTDIQEIGRGSGAKTISDSVLDVQGNPIIDVQINVFLKSKPQDILAQDYTNPSGKWEVFLDPGTYIFEFYHPDFNFITEERVIS